MTREEAINQLQDAKDGYKEYLTDEALDMAIQAIQALAQIKAEIQKALDEDKATDTENAKVQAIALMWCLEIIDKHIGGNE